MMSIVAPPVESTAAPLSVCTLRRIINLRRFADAQSTRYALGGVYCDFRVGQYAATDGWHLCWFDGCKADIDAAVYNVPNITIGSSAIDRTGKIDANCRTAKVSWEQSIGKSGEKSATLTVIDGRFPKVMDAVPSYDATTFPTTISGKASDLVDYFSPSGTVDVSVTNGKPEVSFVEHRQAAAFIERTGPDVDVRIDADMLLVFLTMLPEKCEVIIGIKDESSAVVANGAGYNYVLMPLPKDR